jgi:hypothetical protein
MSGQKIALNADPSEPALNDLMNLIKREVFLDLNCHHVGTVQSFSSSKMTVQASINYTKTFFRLNSATNTYNPVQVTYTPVIDAPIVCIGGGKANLTMPIAKGDECLLLFNDRDIDTWFATGSATSPNSTGRAHSFSDAFALVGVKSTPNVLSTYDAVRALLTDGNASVGVNPTSHLVTVKNVAQGTLGVILQNIITQCEAIGNAVSIPGVPVNTAAATLLLTYATQLQGLLE